MYELLGVIVILAIFLLIIEGIGKPTFLLASIFGAIVCWISFEIFGANAFTNGILVMSIVSYFLGGGTIPKFLFK